MTQQVKTLASIPWIHTVKAENWFLQALACTCVLWHTEGHTHTHTHTYSHAQTHMHAHTNICTYMHGNKQRKRDYQFKSGETTPRRRLEVRNGKGKNNAILL